MGAPAPIIARMSIRTWGAALLALLLLGCSPALNWRELALADGRLHTLFPCKPDRAQRGQPLGEHTLQLQLAGCEAGGALYVVGALQAPAALPLPQLLAHWQQQATSKLQASAWVDEPARVKGADAQPAPLLRRARGFDGSGRALAMEGLWFVREGRLYHAAIYAPQITPEMREPFFGALELR